MREIKFRGFSIESGVWVYGFYREIKCMGIPDHHQIMPFHYPPLSCVVVDPLTVGQFTGLQDKNGKDIYEGGVVENDNGTSYIVVYDADYFGFYLKRLSSDIEEPEHIYGDEVHCFTLRVIEEEE